MRTNVFLYNLKSTVFVHDNLDLHFSFRITVGCVDLLAHWISSNCFSAPNDRDVANFI
ncbi:hypothetical protein DPMN_132290 [Dreissena polymorpha]|uniref:Uncharacterized protein n=1 Tax=Dreissena polymorpha TaxID=45954 RepID=A0A9D4FTJ7_DREPO|nr:hypothetical protein DPMN_132290 [Dreissena polymorpha]